MTTRRAAHGLAAMGLALAVAMPHAAQAAGYDTPIIYSARHLGMGGTAIGYANDPSSIFHNPAGLARLRGSAELTGDVSLLLGKLDAHPGTGATESVKSELTVAPLFLLGANFRVTDWMKAGFAVYPGASAGGTYKYGNSSLSYLDETTLVFIEAAPAVAFEIVDGLTIGAAWRFTLVSLDRVKRASNAQGETAFTLFDVGMSGLSLLGGRIGIQWQINDMISIGAVYRTKTVTDVSDKKGVAGDPGTDIEGTFRLPSKLGVGSRLDIGRFGAALDYEYTFQSENKSQDFTLTKDNGGARVVVPNILNWKDNMTIRVGGEYRLPMSGEGRDMALRLGYLYDGPVNTKRYPTAFGTPPTATHSVTAGLGYRTPHWEVNGAYAFRTGSTTATAEDQAGRDSCAGCGGPGLYKIALHGLYVDFSYRFGDVSEDGDEG